MLMTNCYSYAHIKGLKKRQKHTFVYSQDNFPNVAKVVHFIVFIKIVTIIINAENTYQHIWY